MMRSITHLKQDWKFTRNRKPDAVARICDEADWETVTVPHDWAIAGPFDREHDIDRKVARGQADIAEDVHAVTGRTGGLPHMGEGWYRRAIDIPAASHGRFFRLECDGIMSHSTVYVNGQEAGHWPYGYSSFAFDITDLVKPGETNVIAVHIDNLVAASRWYPGAGIYRNVRLVELAPTHIDHWGVAVTTPSITVARGQVRIRTTLINRGTNQSVTLCTKVHDPDGMVVGTSESNETIIGKAVLDCTIDVNSPQRWSVETPVRYTVRSEVVVDGAVVDSLDTAFGFRTTRFDANLGFFLNEQPLKFKGVCLHHDLGPLGTAVNTAAIKRQLTLLKEMGCNAIRTAHNPPTPELLELTDAMGFLVIDEAFDEWKYAKMPNGYHKLWDKWAEKDLRAMIRRDRNHPSIIMWSAGNEIMDQWQEDGGEVARFLVNIAHDEDPTRPTTAGFNKPTEAIPHGLADAVDIAGWNYYPHIYVQLHTQLPAKPMFASETCAAFSSRGEYYFPVTDELDPIRDTLQVNSYDLSTPSFGYSPDVEFRAQDECPFMMGEFVWSGFDYLGEPGPYMNEWPSRSSYYGILDLGGLPKDRFYLYQSKWSSKAVLHLLPHWTWPGKEGEPIPVHCYTNYPVVELFVNGVSRGQLGQWRNRTLATNYRFMWPAVAYEPGELKVVGYNRKRQVQAEYVVKTAGEPHAIEMTCDRTEIRADGEDMAFVTVRILDADGNLCPRADNSIAFAADGIEVAGLCNGDAASLESFVGTEMKVFNGKSVAYLRSIEGNLGEATLTATAKGLIANTVSITCV